jgi:hypothetical protein
MAVSRFTHAMGAVKATIATVSLLTLVSAAQAAPPSQGALDNLTQRMFGVVGYIELSPSSIEWSLKWLADVGQNPSRLVDRCGLQFFYSKTSDGPQCQKYFAEYAHAPTCLNCSSAGQ